MTLRREELKVPYPHRLHKQHKAEHTQQGIPLLKRISREQRTPETD